MKDRSDDPWHHERTLLMHQRLMNQSLCQWNSSHPQIKQRCSFLLNALPFLQHVDALINNEYPVADLERVGGGGVQGVLKFEMCPFYLGFIPQSFSVCLTIYGNTLNRLLYI